MQFFKKRKQEKYEKYDTENLPVHIGIIMDGNGRWAKKRGLPRNLGHRAGAEVLKKIVEHAGNRDIKAITAYAFSTENWSRPQAEIDGIMNLLYEYLSDFERHLGGKNTMLRIIGDRTPLSDKIKEKILETEEYTKKNTGGIITNIALNYGGRDEIVRAVNLAVKQGGEITEQLLEQNMYTKDSPPVDLIIRPSGEYRLSNFLLWQSAYAELYFDNVLWPDYTPKHLDKAILEFQNRNRRYGGI